METQTDPWEIWFHVPLAHIIFFPETLRLKPWSLFKQVQNFYLMLWATSELLPLKIFILDSTTFHVWHYSVFLDTQQLIV